MNLVAFDHPNLIVFLNHAEFFVLFVPPKTLITHLFDLGWVLTYVPMVQQLKFHQFPFL